MELLFDAFETLFELLLLVRGVVGLAQLLDFVLDCQLKLLELLSFPFQVFSHCRQLFLSESSHPPDLSIQDFGPFLPERCF
mmetsp:Transcript_29077/g.28047  ORF Transcript_29077/g.28047 Transcript_29077/m.28047 type:complete len:81 (+) Transcript_29077:486-728(+)